MLQIAICDRSVEHAVHLESLIRGIEDASVSGIEHYQSPSEFIQALELLHIPDLVFLDVTFNPAGALKIAGELNRRFPAAQVIFMSCFVSHATDVSDAAHAYFLVKPFDPARLRAALAKVQATIEANKDRRLLLPIRGSAAIVLLLSQIVYFERMRRTTVVNCVDANLETGLKLTELETMLPTPQFTRPHNSYLVNLAYAKKIERFCLHLTNGEVLPISNQRRPLFREALETYLK